MRESGRASARARALVRAAAPWFDPTTRKPLVLLVVVALGVFLGPLFMDVARALYGALPSRFRWAIGQAVVVALVAVGLRRLWRVGPSDTWPITATFEPTDRLARAMPWCLRLGVASLLVPILSYPEGGLGFADWDFVLDKFEAVRQTILRWGQFPWWGPWCRGGFPLAAEPQIGAISPATPLVLAFGTTTGLGIAAVLCIGAAVEGAYRLAWLWLREPWSAAAAALVYGLNGAVIINTAWGYVLPMSYWAVPWLALGAFRIGERFAIGVGLGVALALAVLNGIQYITLYAGVLMGLIGLRAFRIAPPDRRFRGLVQALAALGTALALCGWRLATVLFVMKDDQRERISYWDESLFSIPHQLLSRPGPDWNRAIPVQHLATYIETTSYVGPIVVVLALASLYWGWRWWHTLAVVCAALGLGSVRWYHPSAWLQDWPLFASTHVVTRWRFVALLGVGLAAGSALERWRRSGPRWARVLAALATIAIGADFTALAFRQLPLAFSVRPDPERFPGPPVPTIINVRAGIGYACVSRGYGVIQGYEPMVGGYRRDAPTLRRARGAPDYRGEAWTDRGTIQPLFWSPNRIIFQAAPNETVTVNQNPGSWWWANGRAAFPKLRCAELMVPFVVQADPTGRLELEVHPPGLRLGVVLHVVGLVLVGVALGLHRRLERADGPT